MNEEFKDYFEYIYDTVVERVHQIPYAKNLVGKNYFRIKTGFYEDEDPDNIVDELVYQVVEQQKEIVNLIKENKLTESSRVDYPVRTIVRHLTNIIKNQVEGKFYLPEDLELVDDGGNVMLEFDFLNIPNFSIEFEYKIDENLNSDYKLDGEMYDDESVIAIILILNPKSYPKSMYDIIGDLNELLVHEIEHIFQYNWMRPEDEIKPDDLDVNEVVGKEYYMLKHEIPAQLAGFKRLKKLRKQPIEKIIYEWFNRHENIHMLNDYDIKFITKFLSQIYKEKYESY